MLRRSSRTSIAPTKFEPGGNPNVLSQMNNLSNAAYTEAELDHNANELAKDIESHKRKRTHSIVQMEYEDVFDCEVSSAEVQPLYSVKTKDHILPTSTTVGESSVVLTIRNQCEDNLLESRAMLFSLMKDLDRDIESIKSVEKFEDEDLTLFFEWIKNIDRLQRKAFSVSSNLKKIWEFKRF